MNEELEEAIKRLKILLKDSCVCEECMKNKQAYKTVLNYIKNSIPKKKVEEKIEESKKEYNKIHAQHYRDCGILENRIQAKILAYQELLEVE